MYGAIIGDMIGVPYEFHATKKKDFPLFAKDSRYSDDSVMTLAVADALLHTESMEESCYKNEIVRSLIRWGREYDHAGYGPRFKQWLRSDMPVPYGSWGNGSAMRVSPVGWLYDSLEETRKVARWTAEVTHNHEEGIKGAESVASAIFLARNGKTKKEIKNYIESEFGYNLSKTCEEIRPDYKFEVSCQKSVPEAIIAFLDSGSFEDAVRNAVSLGGDADTQACIAGAIAEAYYGVPESLKKECEKRLDFAQKMVLIHFEQRKTKAKRRKES